MMEALSQGLSELEQRILAGEVGRSAYSFCTLSEGTISTIKVQFWPQQVRFFINPLEYDKVPFHKVINHTTISDISADNIVLLNEIKKQFYDFFHGSVGRKYCSYYLNLKFEFKKGLSYTYKEFILEDEARKSELRRRIDEFLTDTVYEGLRPIESEAEIGNLCHNLLDFNLTNYSESKIIDVIKHCFSNTFSQQSNSKLLPYFKDSILYNLKKWSEESFKPLYFKTPENICSQQKLKSNISNTNVAPETLSLWVYASLLSIKFRQNSRLALEDLEIASKEFNSAEATQYLLFGSGDFDNDDISQSNVDGDFKANDVFSRISINIKTESASAYSKALDFIMNLLNKGFPASYSIDLTSESENKFLNIKKIAKSQTHRFFYNCLLYPEIHNKLAEYASLAMKEFEVYLDTENSENECLTGSYAVFGLGLVSEDFFPLLEQYFNTVDDEHHIVHKYFIHNLIERYGVNKRSLPLICKGILSSQHEVLYKELAEIMRYNNRLDLLSSVLRDFSDQDVKTIAYSIWGPKYTAVLPKLLSDINANS
ncbi:DUF6138 family protein [Shewanella algae]|uniref:DUF6138 family protein n=1 Tax=Shewanella algae TaxID=38313 RepID=UPI001BEF9A00|nr:DUF6138 family protein [Shewanella algae]BCV55391.1 hypothetical protein TUM17383_36380 [Shewanella algae]